MFMVLKLFFKKVVISPRVHRQLQFTGSRNCTLGWDTKKVNVIKVFKDNGIELIWVGIHISLY